MFTRLRIIWLTRPSETPSQMARCSRGIIGWSVMRSSVRFSDGLTPKAGAAPTIRSGSGNATHASAPATAAPDASRRGLA